MLPSGVGIEEINQMLALFSLLLMQRELILSVMTKAEQDEGWMCRVVKAFLAATL